MEHGFALVACGLAARHSGGRSPLKFRSRCGDVAIALSGHANLSSPPLLHLRSSAGYDHGESILSPTPRVVYRENCGADLCHWWAMLRGSRESYAKEMCKRLVRAQVSFVFTSVGPKPDFNLIFTLIPNGYC